MAKAKRDFSRPDPGVTDILLAFPGSVKHLMPEMDDIPDEFGMLRHNPYVKFQEQWFFKGIEKMPEAKPGIDTKAAMRHLSAIQHSFEPKHEHKCAAVAYLASLWFEEPE